MNDIGYGGKGAESSIPVQTEKESLERGVKCYTRQMAERVFYWLKRDLRIIKPLVTYYLLNTIVYEAKFRAEIGKFKRAAAQPAKRTKKSV